MHLVKLLLSFFYRFSVHLIMSFEKDFSLNILCTLILINNKLIYYVIRIVIIYFWNHFVTIFLVSENI